MTTAIDRAAMTLAIGRARAESADSRERIEEILAREGFAEAGETAAYWAQDTALRLRPWQTPPCWVHDIEGELAAGDDGDDVHGRKRAARLLRRMRDLGISRWHPDPVAAIAEAEAAAAAGS